MARPIKEGLDYFPLDVDIDSDDKVAMVEALHGNEGFAVVIKLMAKIYKEGYYYEWSNREQILFSKRVNVNINTLKDIINDCINEGLFNRKLYENYSVLTSKGIQKRYLEAVKRRKQVTFYEKYFLIDDVRAIVGSNKIEVLLINEDEKRVNVNINSINDDISTQRKGKERKGKESINNNSDEPTAKPKQNVFEFYQQNFGVLQPFIAEDIGHWIDDISEELVIEAMKLALQSDKPWKYASGILKDWQRNNLKTLADVEAYQVSFENKNKANNNAVDWEALKANG